MSATPAPPTTSPTTAVGDYIIGHEIGRGSFATVYMGKTISTGRPVAVKSVSRDKLNRKLAENLESEIKILKGISHRNVVALLDIMKTDKHIHLIMEYCSLGDLSNYIKRRGLVAGASVEAGQWNSLSGPWGGLNEVVVRHFLQQLASAMEFLRAHSLIHRDLKPQNVLLSPASPDSPPIKVTNPSPANNTQITIPPLPILKLADFGFARALPSHSLASTLCGSPLYMAPEILRGDKYDAKADLWSFGAIVYEMICGRPPFKAQNHIDLLRKIERGEGVIRFPGDELGRDSVTARRNSQSSSLPSNARLTGTSPLSSSPRFPPMMKGVQPIGEDLKDLVRRLLKRNPAERMTFEEFFAHPSIISNRAIVNTPVPSFQQHYYGEAVPMRRRASNSSKKSMSSTPPAGDPPFAVAGATPPMTEALFDVTNVPAASEGFGAVKEEGQQAGLPAALQRVHTSPAKPGLRRGETMVLGMAHEYQYPPHQQHGAGNVEGGYIPSGIFTSSPHDLERVSDAHRQYPSPLPLRSGHQYQHRPDMTRQASAPGLHTIHSNDSFSGGVVEHGKVAGFEGGVVPPFSSVIVEEQEESNMEDKGKEPSVGGGVEMPFPGYGNVDVGFFEGVKEGMDREQQQGKENNSSVSSLGSLVLSDEDGTSLVTDSNAQIREGKPLTGSGNVKGSLEEYVVVEKRVVEVNWLADEVAGAVGSGSGSGVGVFPTVPQQQQHTFLASSVGNVPISIPITTPTTQLGTSPTSSGSPRTHRPDRKPQSRIFGSLRESTHQFLNVATATISSSSQHTGSGSHSPLTPPVAYTAAMNSTSPTRMVFHLNESTISHNNTATTFHPDLTPLNLLALRGHAVQRLAASPSLLPSESLGCYLLALRCYQVGMEVARQVWENWNRSKSVGERDLRMLSVGVQWVRERFNECLEGAGRCERDVEEDEEGRSVERVVYEGALEVSRHAALLELTSPTPPKECEGLYRQAILLVEALLGCAESENESEISQGEDGGSVGMTDEDRRVLERFVACLWGRVGVCGSQSGGAS